MRPMLALCCLLALAACGGPAAAPLTAQAVLDRFAAAGLSVQDPKADPPAPDSPLPKSYREQRSFTIASVAPKGGQVFVCDTKQNCDAIFAYFDSLKALAGPYLYRAPSGLVVVQLNSGLTPDEAARYQQVVSALP